MTSRSGGVLSHAVQRANVPPWPVAVFEGEFANGAAVTVVFEAFFAGVRIALVLVHLDPRHSTLGEGPLVERGAHLLSGKSGG